MEHWINDNWFNLLNAFGIIGGLLFTAHSLRSETETRRIANLLTLVQNHRELWKEFINHPELGRILDSSVNLDAHPVTTAETAFVTMMIQHLGGAFQTMQSGLLIQQEGLRQDVATFFTLPIPHAIWQETKAFQNDDFLAFVTQCLG